MIKKENLLELVIKTLERRGVILEDIGKIGMEIQKKYSPELTMDLAIKTIKEIYNGAWMILVFLVILIITLIIANILVSAAYPRKSERGFVEPFLNKEETIQPEVIDNINDIKENNMLIQGSLQTTNKKLEMLHERISSLEKVVITMVENKVSNKN